MVLMGMVWKIHITLIFKGALLCNSFSGGEF
jgi:hypothetical protein